MILGKFQVAGHSMEPQFHEGDTVLALKFLPIKQGHVVVFRKASKTFLKRIKKVTPTGYLLVGDNTKDSYDSRQFGEVKKRDIMGRVVCKL